MADIGTRLRTLLLSSAVIANLCGERCHQGNVPQSVEGDYIWFTRSGVNQLQTLDANTSADPLSQSFDVEVVSESIDRAQQIADAVRAFNAYRGTFGDSTTKGIFVEDQSDDYVPRNLFDDNGPHVAALAVEVF